MKKYTFFILLAAWGSLLYGQGSLRYHFENALTEATGSGPALAVLGNPGVYVLDTLNEISGKTKIVYRFEKNSGFQFDNSSNFITGTYSIELYFVFDNLNSWKRVIDWRNRKSDNGAYVYYGQLNFYPYVYSSGTAPVVEGEYTYYVVTRDSVTKQTLLYTDAKKEIEFTDNNNDAVTDGDQVLNFFYDDLVVPNEASSGAVALLNIYNYVLDSNAIKQNFNALNQQVFSTGQVLGKDDQLNIYPNPAKDYLVISVEPSAFSWPASLSLINASGKVVLSRDISRGGMLRFSLDSPEIPGGIYLVRVQSGSKVLTRKVMVNR